MGDGSDNHHAQSSHQQHHAHTYSKSPCTQHSKASIPISYGSKCFPSLLSSHPRHPYHKVVSTKRTRIAQRPHNQSHPTINPTQQFVSHRKALILRSQTLNSIWHTRAFGLIQTGGGKISCRTGERGSLFHVSDEGRCHVVMEMYAPVPEKGPLGLLGCGSGYRIECLVVISMDA